MIELISLYALALVSASIAGLISHRNQKNSSFRSMPSHYEIDYESGTLTACYDHEPPYYWTEGRLNSEDPDKVFVTYSFEPIALIPPAQMRHPGRFLRDEIEARDYTLMEFSLLSGLNYGRIGQIIDGQEKISKVDAIKIGSVLGMTEDIAVNFWLNMQANYDKWLTQKIKESGGNISNETL